MIPAPSHTTVRTGPSTHPMPTLRMRGRLTRHKPEHILPLNSTLDGRMNWLPWFHTQWSALTAGRKIIAPEWLPDPRIAGFKPIALATPEGQCADWGLSLTDGSRIHVHEFPNGRRVAHRDRYDPDQGFLRALAHVFMETWVGPAAIAAGLVLLATSSAKA